MDAPEGQGAMRRGEHPNGAAALAQLAEAANQLAMVVAESLPDDDRETLRAGIAGGALRMQLAIGLEPFDVVLYVASTADLETTQTLLEFRTGAAPQWGDMTQGRA